VAERPLGGVSRFRWLPVRDSIILSLSRLVFVDLHPRPFAFSFADEIAERLQFPQQPSLQAPYAISYRVNSASSGETTVAVRRFSLKVGDCLPNSPLAIGFPDVVIVDLEETYRKAAASAYVE